MSKQRDLGILIASDLSWSHHYNCITSKAYRSLNLIRCSISAYSPISTKRYLYIYLVRSQLTYCSQIWRPYLLKDVKMLERVQRRATKFILSDCPTTTYRERLLTLASISIDVLAGYSGSDVSCQITKRTCRQHENPRLCYFCICEHPISIIRETSSQLYKVLTVTPLLF